MYKIVLLKTSGFEEGTCSPWLPHSASPANKLEHFIHVEVVDQIISEYDVRNGEVSTVAEGLVSNDVGQEVAWSQFLHLVQVLGTEALFSVDCHSAEQQLQDKIINLINEFKNAVFDGDGTN